MPNQLLSKVFFIGLNKTGTTSYHNMLKTVVGKKAAHRAIWTDWAFSRNKTKLDKYDVFTDGECANLYNLDEFYPRAKYVLNTRSLEGWLISRHKSIERSRLLNKWFFRKILPIIWLQNYINTILLDNSERAMKRWIEIRNSYHIYALDFFKDRPSDLLVLDLSEDDAATRLENFLELETPLKSEHKNGSGKDLRSGMMFDALKLEYNEKISQKKVGDFLRKEGLTPFKDEKLHFQIEAGVGHNDAKWISFPSSWIRCAVAGRARSSSFLGKFIYDQMISLLRAGLEDMNRFVPTHRYGSGAK